MKLSDKYIETTQRAIVFGSPKSGKTELAGNLSKEFNLLWFDLENGYSTLLKLPLEQQQKIEIIAIPDTKVFPIAIETMLKVVTGIAVEICEAHGKVSCQLCKKDSLPTVRVCLNELTEDWIVVVDSLTQLANSAMNHLTKSQDDLYKPEWGDYRNQGQLMDKFLSQVQQSKFNIVCITHETETEMEDGKKKLVPVAGTVSFSRNTAKYFDHVVYCEVKNRKHAFASSTTYSGSVLTGSRTDIGLEKDTIPTLLRIFSRKGQRSHVDESKSSVKVENTGAVGAVTEVTEVKAKTEVVSNKTPGQIALEALKAKNSLTAKKV